MRKFTFFIILICVCISLLYASEHDSYSNALHLKKVGFIKEASMMLYRLANDKTYILNDYAQYELAKLYEENGLIDNAISEYLSLTEKYFDSALTTRCYIKVAELKYKNNDIKAAAFYYDKAVEKGVSNFKKDYARFRAGICYEKLGEFEEAAERYSQIMNLHVLSSYFERAKERLKLLAIMPRQPTLDELFERAELLFEKKDYVSAAKNYKTIIERFPGSTYAKESLLKLGICYYKSGFFQTAVKIFDSTKTVFPEALFYKGQALIKSGNFSDALMHFSKIVEIFPDSEFASNIQLKIADYFYGTDNKGLAEEIYSNIIKNTHSNAAFLEAVWKKGFSQYLEGNFEQAYNTFGQALEKNIISSKVAACIFWQAKSAEKMGLKDVAYQLFETTHSLYPNSYYGFRAAQILNKDLPAYNKRLIFSMTFDYNETDNIHWKKFCELFKARAFDDAFEEAQYYYSIGKNQVEKAKAKTAIASIFAARKDFQKAISYVEENFEDNILSDSDIDSNKTQAICLLYPRWYRNIVEKYSKKFKVEPSLIYAIIREESRFNSFALSRAYAHGLTQIIPSTGRIIAKILKIDNYTTSKLFNPEINIKMGSFYISQLLKLYNGNMHLALAAYNGGSGRVKKWKKENGIEDIDEFVEKIPFRETRGYVKKVLKSYWMYKRLYEIDSRTAEGEKFYGEAGRQNNYF